MASCNIFNQAPRNCQTTTFHPSTPHCAQGGVGKALQAGVGVASWGGVTKELAVPAHIPSPIVEYGPRCLSPEAFHKGLPLPGCSCSRTSTPLHSFYGPSCPYQKAFRTSGSELKAHLSAPCSFLVKCLSLGIVIPSGLNSLSPPPFPQKYSILEDGKGNSWLRLFLLLSLSVGTQSGAPGVEGRNAGINLQSRTFASPPAVPRTVPETIHRALRFPENR